MTTILEEKTDFQKLEVKKDPDYPGGVILSLDDSWQFASATEYRYHEGMATIPMCVAEEVDNVLICGGGDGLALREVLKFKDVDHADLVEIDQRMIDLFSKDSYFSTLNNGAFEDPRVHVTVADAKSFISNPCRAYDVIILDFPSPTPFNLGKNYRGLFNPQQIMQFAKLLKPGGVMAMQSSIEVVLISRIMAIMQDAGFFSWNYDVYYDTDGDHDNFSVFCKNRLERHREAPPTCRYVSNRHVEVATGKATEVTPGTLEYYSLFQYTEEMD